MDSQGMDQTSNNQEPAQVPVLSAGEWSGRNGAYPGLFGSQTSMSTASSEETTAWSSPFRNTTGITRASDSLLHEDRVENREFATRDLVYERWLVRRLSELRRMYESESRPEVQDVQAALLDTFEDWLCSLTC